MADPSRQISESGGRDNPRRRRSAEERPEVDDEANLIDANNNTRRNLDVDAPSPDSQIVTSTTPEDLDSSREMVEARGSSEATPPSSVESPSLEDDLPPADSPENREVTSTSNLIPHSTTTSPPVLRDRVGMSIDESRLNDERNANEIGSSSGHISSSIQEVPRRRNLNTSLQNPTEGVGRSNAASEDTPLFIVSRELLNSPNVTTASGLLQSQPSTSGVQQRPSRPLGFREVIASPLVPTSSSSVSPASSSTSSSLSPASSSTSSSLSPASCSSKSCIASASTSPKCSPAPAPSSQTRPLAQAPSSSTRHPVPKPAAATSKPTCPVQNDTSSKPLTLSAEGQKKVVKTSSKTDLKSSDHPQASKTQMQKPLSVSSQSTSSMSAKGTKEELKTINVPQVSNNPPSNSSSPQSLTKSPIKSPIKRQANPPTQVTSNDSDDIDNTLSPIKRLKIASSVGEGSQQSEENGSPQKTAEVKCEEMDDDSVLEIPSEKNDSEDENSN